MVWKQYPNVESELFNVHGLNHKINFEVDYRDAYSNVKLNQLGIQDDLDDNTYEVTRRYFALTNYAGGILPPQYDPRHLILRRAISPITGTTDVQASIETLQLNLHQRLQTKRGPEGRRRIIDYMTLDVTSTYFPYAQRDNFGKPFGQNMYNWQWFIGDRTSIISYGWFEFFKITGKPLYATNPARHNDPFGLNVITSGISISRPPRGNVFIGYTVLDTGPITTSALNTTITTGSARSGIGTYSNMYDFGNAILLSSYVLGHPDRRRLPDLDRPERRPATAELHVRVPDLAPAQPEHSPGLGRRDVAIRFAVRADSMSTGGPPNVTGPDPHRRKRDRMVEDPAETGPARDPVAAMAEGNTWEGEFDPSARWTARAGRRNSREKVAAGLLGLKHAIRGDSSFFAHGYRGTLIALTAALLGVSPWGWCLLVIAACLVLLSELTHSAVDTLARTIGDPEEPRLKWPARSPPAACWSPSAPPPRSWSSFWS